MRVSSLQLLPQSSKTQIPNHLKYSKVLQLVKFFTQHAVSALEAFYIKENFYEFDPHVGENACQIRAYQIALIASNINKEIKYIIYRKIEQLSLLISKIEKDLPHYQKLETTRQKIYGHYVTLEEFILKNKYYFEINETELFLILTKILTNYKAVTVQSKSNICYSRLTKDLGASKNTARELVHLYQVNISKISCGFILELANQLPYSKLDKDNFRVLQQSDDDGRIVLPCFWTMKAIYSHLVYKKILIMLVIKRIHNQKVIEEFILTSSPSNNYNFSTAEETMLKNSEMPCFVIKGEVIYTQPEIELRQTFIMRLQNLGIEKLFLLNAAIHPQYSGKKLHSLSSNPLIDYSQTLLLSPIEQEYFALREQADYVGCSIRNSSLLYIYHMYCDKVQRIKTSFNQPPSKRGISYLDNEKQYV